MNTEKEIMGMIATEAAEATAAAPPSEYVLLSREEWITLRASADTLREALEKAKAEVACIAQVNNENIEHNRRRNEVLRIGLEKIRALKPKLMGGLDPEAVFDICDHALSATEVATQPN